MMKKVSHDHKLIVTIVKKGKADMIVEAAREAGARGGTILHGRGVGIHENKKILGIPIEPEKEIVFTLIAEELADQVLSAIITAGNLNQPGKGICFVLDVEKVLGVVCLLEQLGEKEV